MVPLQNTVASAYNGAVGGTQQAMGMNLGMTPMMAPTSYATGTPATTATGTAQGYNAFTGLNSNGQAMAGFGGTSAGGSGYTAEQMAGVGNVTAGQLANTNLDPYMNPYTDNVINQTQADMERARLIAQNQMDDSMGAAGAFGGSRHGIANAETNRAYYDRLGATTGNLRNLGFQNAQQAAFQDITNKMQADLANQGMEYQVGAGNRDATNTARMTGANNATSASIANANNSSQLAGQRMGAVNDASRFNAGAANDMSRFNAGATNDTSRFNSSLGADLSQFNASASNANNQFNANSYNTFGQNQFNNQMNAASQLGNLSDLGFGMFNTMSGQQASDGAQQQAIQQQIIDAAKNQFTGYSNAGNLGLGALQSGVAAAPGGAATTTSSSSPGVGGLLSMFL